VLVGDVLVFDETGALVSMLHGARLRYLEGDRGLGRASVDDWFYQVGWEMLEPTLSPSRSSWMLVGGPCVLARAIAGELRHAGDECVVLETVDDLTSALEGFSASSKLPTGVVYLDGLMAHEPSAAAGAGQSTRCMDLLGAVKQLAAFGPGCDARLFVMTRGAQAVNGDLSPEAIWQTPLIGLGRTLAVEHGEIWGGLIDLDPSVADDDNARELARYLKSARVDDQVALRAGRWWGARLERRTVAAAPPLRLRSDATYVITGGTGGLGLELARWMAASGARWLVLLARTPLPPRSEWRNAGAASAAIRTIEDLEAAGVSVRVASVDVSDAAACARFFDQFQHESWPAVRGIVHAAGVLEHGTAVEMDADQIDRLLRPKLAAWTLHRQLASTDLDFFVMFSSASAVLGSPRLGGYAAGNAFLDGVGVVRASQGAPSLSINWGMWGEAGMASRFETTAVQAHADRGMGLMTTAEGLDALERLLAARFTRAAVLPIEWTSWSRLFPAYMNTPFFSRLPRRREVTAPAGAQTSALDRLARVSAVDRPVLLTAVLAEILSAVSGFAAGDLDRDRPITEYGLDSLMALEFKNRVQTVVGVALGIVDVLEGPSIAELAQRILPLVAVGAEAPVGADDDRALLARIDTLTDDDVEGALARLLAESVPGRMMEP
jgi:NAD(P)-dependent dehydrogenase (short-subunit alcohol dehydrogenase family)